MATWETASFSEQISACWLLLRIEEELCISPYPPRRPGIVPSCIPSPSPYVVGELATQIGSRIHTRRVLKGWTQEDLAERTGEDNSTVSRHERGKHLTLDNISLYVKALECSLDDLIPDGKAAQLFDKRQDRINAIISRFQEIRKLPDDEFNNVIDLVQLALNMALRKGE